MFGKSQEPKVKETWESFFKKYTYHSGYEVDYIKCDGGFGSEEFRFLDEAIHNGYELINFSVGYGPTTYVFFKRPKLTEVAD